MAGRLTLQNLGDFRSQFRIVIQIRDGRIQMDFFAWKILRKRFANRLLFLLYQYPFGLVFFNFLFGTGDKFYFYIDPN